MILLSFGEYLFQGTIFSGCFSKLNIQKFNMGAMQKKVSYNK